MKQILTKGLYDAIQANFVAQRDKAMYQMHLAFQNPVAVGEHPKIVEDCLELLKQISEAEEALESLEANFGDMND
jgi:hypothetical protein|tara:strand:- start:41 stop:265 length:225 start_codon:yes stop_codon:yes gene_type:complete